MLSDSPPDRMSGMTNTELHTWAEAVRARTAMAVKKCGQMMDRSDAIDLASHRLVSRDWTFVVNDTKTLGIDVSLPPA
jgi:hypothetical protein